MFDIDHFKEVNDSYGHAFGDLVLRRLAQICQQTLRHTDLICRYGGDEFVVMLPNCDLAHALIMGWRLCQKIADELFTPEDAPVRVTISLGAAERDERTNDLSQLLENADRALYRAKETGRNRVAH